MSDSWYRGGRRAVDDTEKDEVIARLLALWKQHPQLRLMQLLGNVFRRDPYYVEDFDAVEILEQAYAEMRARADARKMPSRSELKRWATTDEVKDLLGIDPLPEKAETPDTEN